MSRKDAVILASRTLAVLLLVWVFSDVTSLPEIVHSFRRYQAYAPRPSTDLDYIEYTRHYYLIRLAFLVVRIVGLAAMSRWLFKGGAEVEELLLPSALRENVS